MQNIRLHKSPLLNAILCKAPRAQSRLCTITPIPGEAAQKPSSLHKKEKSFNVIDLQGVTSRRLQRKHAYAS